MYDLSSDWVLAVDRSSQATLDEDGKIKIPVSVIEPDYQFFSTTIGIFISSQSASPNWYAAGELFQAYLVGFGLAGYAQGEYIKATLNRYHIHRFTKFPFLEGESKYLLSYSPKKYLQDIRLQVWEYKGTNQGASNEDLQKSINAVHQRVINAQEILNKINKKVK